MNEIEQAAREWCAAYIERRAKINTQTGIKQRAQRLLDAEDALLDACEAPQQPETSGATIARLAREYAAAWRACDEWYKPGGNYNHELGEKVNTAWHALIAACAEPPQPITPESAFAIGIDPKAVLHDEWEIEYDESDNSVWLSRRWGNGTQVQALGVKCIEDVHELMRLIGREEQQP